jgi:primosomal protein N' (replication factor Y)
MKCHYCGYTEKQVDNCGACGSHEVTVLGLGTQKIEEEIYKYFSEDIRVKRMDWDTTRKKSSFQEIIDQFEQKEIDILVGTQMVSKGLDFDHVGLVGVLQADDLLHYPDFRAYERCFQLLTQVSGRSGRKNERGKVILQSFDPYHWVLQKVMDYDFDALYQQELADRKHFKYPPFYRMIKMTLLHKKSANLFSGANFLANQLKSQLGDRVLGPEFTIIPRINNYYQQQIIIKIEKELSLSKVKAHIRQLIDQWSKEDVSKSIRVKIDVDPM